MKVYLLFVCLYLASCRHSKQETTTPTAPESQSETPSTPNRFDTLAWPEVTTGDKFFFASRVAPAFIEASERKQIALSMLSEPTTRQAIEPFLSAALPPRDDSSYTSTTELPSLAKAALWYGVSSSQWVTLSEKMNNEKKSIQLRPLLPPGNILIEQEKIKVQFTTTDGFEWSSYLLCKALLRGSTEIRIDFLGDSLQEYRWTPGEEELCLWALAGTREHLRSQANMNRAPSEDPALVRFDQAAQSGHVLGFVLVEFLLPRRGSLAGLSEKELDAAALYLLSEAAVSQNPQ